MGEAEGSKEQNILLLVLTKQLQKYILMTCHCPKAYETSRENIVSRSQTLCLPSPASSFFYTDNQKPKLWLCLPQAAQLRATFSWTCEDYYDLTTIDPANKCSFSLTFLVLSVVLSELGCGSCFSHFQQQCQNLHEHLLDKHWLTSPKC